MSQETIIQLQLEDLAYQQDAIDTAVKVFEGQCFNASGQPSFMGVNANTCNLNNEVINKNKADILVKNNLSEGKSHLSDERQACIEMETGTGKTLVYIRTIYELHKAYGYTKFIILVPSIAIKEGIKSTLESFKDPLKQRYSKTIHSFEYNSKDLNQLKHFIQDNNPQIMLTTIQAFTAEERILNQTERDDSIDGMSYLKALGSTRPIIIMDEPQEGMDTELAQKRLATLNPLYIFRYSATHKRVINRLYRLTPADAYNAGMVKRIEVLTVAEKNDEATLKIELIDVQAKAGQNPKAKLKLWHNTASGFKLKDSRWLKVGDNLANVTNNISYQDYTVERISKGLRDKTWSLESNGIIFNENQKQGDIEGLFRIQLYWLIRTHFEKKAKLSERGIKCLSLIFIDRVDNYLGADPLIKRLFAEEYAKVAKELNLKANSEQIEACQGYYFAKTSAGDYTDSESSMKKNKAIYDRILKKKQRLLSFDDEIEFIFSHSALGVGWDNPNIFNIATLNHSYSETKKRQELGRGLRICVNQKGERIYDSESYDLNDEINLLTIIPNETYETFALQYQNQIAEELGDKNDGARLRKNIKGKADTTTLTRNDAHYKSTAFQDFWQKISQKTDFTVKFDEANIIKQGIEKLNAMTIADYQAEVSLNRITDMEGLQAEHQGSETQKLQASFSAMDLIEVLSEQTSLSYRVVLKIVNGLTNLDQLIKNPPNYLQQASNILKRIELDEMYRATQYNLTGESLDITIEKQLETALATESTPHRGIYDFSICDSDSNPEHNFASAADIDPQILCFIKLPNDYKISTPIGRYNPDFGVIVRKKGLRDEDVQDYYFVVETKSTNDLDDGTLREEEVARIKYAIKHFEALGISTLSYIAPVKDYEDGFKHQATKAMSQH